MRIRDLLVLSLALPALLLAQTPVADPLLEWMDRQAQQQLDQRAVAIRSIRTVAIRLFRLIARWTILWRTILTPRMGYSVWSQCVVCSADRHSARGHPGVLRTQPDPQTVPVWVCTH